MLKKRFINSGDIDLVMALTFLYMLNTKKKPISLKTVERRLQTPLEKIAPEKLAIFCGVLKVKPAELQNPHIFFHYDGKKWQKKLVQEGGAEA